MMEFSWPQKQCGAVSLTFDDGMESHLNKAIPILEAHGLQGAFYVNPNEAFLAQSDQWIGAHERGHEIGNHTVSHPCSENFAFITQSGRRPLESFSLDDMAHELTTAQQLLVDLLGEPGPLSFAYPCYQPYIGKGEARQSYVPLVARRFVAGRGRGEMPNDPLRCDPAYLWSFPCERMTGAQMVGLAEEAIAAGRWTIMTFHGIHEGHLSVADRDFEMLCAHLATHRERVWTPTVAECALYLGKVQAAHATPG